MITDDIKGYIYSCCDILIKDVIWTSNFERVAKQCQKEHCVTITAKLLCSLYCLLYGILLRNKACSFLQDHFLQITIPTLQNS